MTQSGNFWIHSSTIHENTAMYFAKFFNCDTLLTSNLCVCVVFLHNLSYIYSGRINFLFTLCLGNKFWVAIMPPTPISIGTLL